MSLAKKSARLSEGYLSRQCRLPIRQSYRFFRLGFVFG